MKKLNLVQICQADLTELFSYSQSLQASTELNPDLGFYLKCLIAFYKNDLLQLEDLISTHASLVHKSFLKLAQMRCDLKRRQEVSFSIADFDGANEKNLILAEAHFITGQAYYSQKEFAQALSSFVVAKHLYTVSEAFKKAVRSEFNILSCQSCIRPEGRYFQEYLTLAQNAIDVGDWLTVGTAYVNVSREYQSLGAFLAALKYSNLALQLSSRHSAGTRQYYLLLLHRADVLIDLQRLPEAKIDLEEAIIFTEPAIQEIVLSLQAKIQGLKINSELELATWQERSHEEEVVEGLSDLEQLVVQNLSHSSMSKTELILELYGEKIDAFAAENRLKNLLNRLRKKRPGAFYFSEGRYHLVDKSLAKGLKNA